MEPGADQGVLSSFAVIHGPEVKRSLLPRIALRARSAIFPSPPHSAIRLDAKDVLQKLETLLAGRRWDAILWVTTGYADDVLPVLRQHSNRVVIDAIDSRYSYELKTAPKHVLDRWDRYWLGRWELRVVQKYDAALYISVSDISDLEALQSGFKTKVHHLPNGCTTEDYVPDIARIPSLATDDFVIGYLGHMGYPPNISAATRLKRVFDRVARIIPEARLMIIGRSPAKPIRMMAEDPRVIVTGTVDSIWPYVNRANVFVFPMEAGAGQQNKVMEAMYAGKPVVTTPIGNRGIGASNGRAILLAETDEEVIDHLVNLASSSALRHGIGNAGRAFLEETYSWEQILPRFKEALAPIQRPGW
jgi:glycosyltransferase involved in cell wall biosynthesis